MTSYYKIDYQWFFDSRFFLFPARPLFAGIRLAIAFLFQHYLFCSFNLIQFSLKCINIGFGHDYRISILFREKNSNQQFDSPYHRYSLRRHWKTPQKFYLGSGGLLRLLDIFGSCRLRRCLWLDSMLSGIDWIGPDNIHCLCEVVSYFRFGLFLILDTATWPHFQIILPIKNL